MGWHVPWHSRKFVQDFETGMQVRVGQSPRDAPQGWPISASGRGSGEPDVVKVKMERMEIKCPLREELCILSTLLGGDERALTEA